MLTGVLSTPFLLLLPTSSTIMSSFNQHRKRPREVILTVFRSKLSQVSPAAYLVALGCSWPVGWEWTTTVKFLFFNVSRRCSWLYFVFPSQCVYVTSPLLWLCLKDFALYSKYFFCILCSAIMLAKAAHSGWVVRTRDRENSAGIYIQQLWELIC